MLRVFFYANNSVFWAVFFKRKTLSLQSRLTIKNKYRIIQMSTTRIYNGIERPLFTPEAISTLKSDEVFVFGSNLQGHHGGGAARVAQSRFGAVWGQGVGLQGQSYAIPTMQGGVETIKPYVNQFIVFAKNHTELFFYVTRIGCGIAGFKDEDIAPLFSEAVGMDNICLPESFAPFMEQPPFPEISRHASLRLMQQGQTRTLADIAMCLNDQHHYSDLESLMRDFDNTIEAYIERGTVSIESCEAIRNLILENATALFSSDGYLDFDKFIEMVDDLSTSNENNPLEVIYSRREKTKLLRLAALLNDIVHYTTANELMSDLCSIATGRFNCGDNRYMNDSFHYPLYFFKRGLEHVWSEIQENGYMNNGLLEQKMFTEHEEKVEELGLKRVIRNDYFQDGPCHPEVYFPKRMGTAPVYVLDEHYRDHCTGEPLFVKSCGEGKGPNAHSTLYDMNLVMRIINRECAKGKYEKKREYYIPVGDDTKPVFNQWHGVMEFDILADKSRFLQKIRSVQESC